MQLNTLKREHPNKNPRPRVGRSGKRGTTSGKGQKGQKSRSGHRIRPAVRDLIQRLPKLRGHANKSIATKPLALNVGDLARLNISTVNLETLRKAGVISARGGSVKILAGGELKQAVTIEKLPVSKEAKKKIEAAGGKII